MRVLKLETELQPFGDRVGEIPLLDHSLESLRTRELERARIPSSAITMADYAFATAPVLEAFRRQSPIDKPVRLALAAQSPNRIFTPVSSVEHREEQLLYDIYLNAPVDWSLERLRLESQVSLIRLPTRSRRRFLPKLGAAPHHIDYPTNGILAAHIEHWVHVLWLAPCLVPSLLGKKSNLVGENVRIHPKATLDGAVIGDNTVVGPGCVVRDSYIGPDSYLSDYTKVRHSVLGRKTHTLADASFSHVVSFGGATLANLLLRDVLLGHDCFVTTGVIFWNQSLDKPVHVLHQGREVSTEKMALGGCAGHGCVLGARAIVAPGRALPNRTTVVMRKEESVHSIHDAPSGTAMCWHNGALVPAAGFLTEGVPDELNGDRRAYTSEPLSEPRTL